ncbi:energy transducer TonB [Paraglaciecola hydrolytica]|uniref:TonB C-terminal domain-containing protein n=1 Tax=Paraglaciecola hydrolytica TaxID=1799789 RepID=A0A136A1C3_9ALTE|nr:energy transducer TonB [Paraglaciecola hydrolytica]KXI29036.1 hypothetical protein AX660_12775 [Paraglaciecola hydrolytica]
MRYLLLILIIMLCACASQQPTKPNKLNERSTTTPTNYAHASESNIVGSAIEIQQKMAQRTLQTTAGKIQILASVFPTYPQPLLEQNITHRVVIEFIVNEFGEVEQPKILSQANCEFDQVSLEAISQWKFAPIIEDGKVVRIKARQAFNFEIR